MLAGGFDRKHSCSHSCNTPILLPLQAEVEALKTAVAREKHSREAQQRKCAEMEASLRR